MERRREFPSANVVSKSLGRTSFQSVECDTVAKNWKLVRPSDLLLFAASIGEVCNCRQNQGVNVSMKDGKSCIKIARSRITSIGEVRYIRQILGARATERFVRNCRQKTSGRWVVSKSISRTSIGEVRSCRQNRGAMGGIEIARSHLER